MAYKDKDRQREAVRQAVAKSRAKGITEGITSQGITWPKDVTPVIPNMPVNYSQPECECRHCQNNRRQNNRLFINHGPYKTAAELKSNEVNRQAMPGDADYEGVMRHEGGGGLDEGFTPNGAGAE